MSYNTLIALRSVNWPEKTQICARKMIPMWFRFLLLSVFWKGNKSEWLNEANMLSGKSLEDEKAKHVPQPAPDQTASGMLDEMRGCGKWGWLILLSVPLPTSIRLLLLHLLFCYHTQMHINTRSLCVCVSLSLSVILSSNTKHLSPALVLLTHSFQTQRGGIG